MLYSLEPLSFAHFRKMKELILSRNQKLGFNNASRAWFGLKSTNIKTLKLRSMTSDDEETSILDSSFFEYLNLTSINSLYLDLNNLVHIEPRFSETLPKLGTLSLPGKQLRNADKLIDDLANLTELRSLDVSSLDLELPSFNWPRQRDEAFYFGNEVITSDELNNSWENPDISKPQINCVVMRWSSYPRCCNPRRSEQTKSSFGKHMLGNRRAVDPVCIKIAPKLKILKLNGAIRANFHILPQIVIIGGKFLTSISLASNGLLAILGPIFFTEPPAQLQVDLSDNYISCLADSYSILLSKWQRTYRTEY
jgi:hypothetical protein